MGKKQKQRQFALSDDGTLVEEDIAPVAVKKDESPKPVQKPKEIPVLEGQTFITDDGKVDTVKSPQVHGVKIIER